MYHKNLHVSVEKAQMLTLQDLEEISPMSGLFYVLFLSLLMKHSVICFTTNVMLQQVTGGLIQAATFMLRNFSQKKNEYLGKQTLLNVPWSISSAF